jgi:hypothetical protein
MTVTQNFKRQFVRVGNEGIGLGSNAATGPGMVSDSPTSLYTTRGSIDLNLARLPGQNDCTVRPSDPIVVYDRFIVSAAGAVPVGVGGVANLNAGDYLVLTVDSGAATPADWVGMVNNAAQYPNSTTSSAYNGQQNLPPVIVDQQLPFFP